MPFSYRFNLWFVRKNFNGFPEIHLVVSNNTSKWKEINSITHHFTFQCDICYWFINVNLRVFIRKHRLHLLMKNNIFVHSYSNSCNLTCTNTSYLTAFQCVSIQSRFQQSQKYVLHNENVNNKFQYFLSKWKWFVTKLLRFSLKNLHNCKSFRQ